MPPLPPEAWTPEMRTMFTILEGPDAYETGSKSNVFLTLARHPDLAGSFIKFNSRLLLKGKIPARLREIVILRIGWLARSRYEWAQHVRIALMPDAMSKEQIEAFRRGEAAVEGDGLLSRAEVDAVKRGSDHPAWSELERLALRAVDECRRDTRVGDETWAGLSRHLSEPEMIELLFVIGVYTLQAIMLNSLGVEPEAAQLKYADELPAE
ncbi:MAG TPA: carboxymuconolactone decarboxylase family protein [Reyranella sp.]|nr:carboxymuconolactone decarboxylase family protein [Reyranella sp.]